MNKHALSILAALIAPPVLADPGLHHHPHGVTGLWIAAAVVLAAVPGAALVLKRIRK